MKNLLYISIFTTIIMLSWVVFGIYHNNTTSTITRDKEIIITSIPPNFDEETLNKIRLRKVVEADLSSGRNVASGSPSTSINSSLSPSEISPVPETPPTASPAATL